MSFDGAVQIQTYARCKYVCSMFNTFNQEQSLGIHKVLGQSAKLINLLQTNLEIRTNLMMKPICVALGKASYDNWANFHWGLRNEANLVCLKLCMIVLSVFVCAYVLYLQALNTASCVYKVSCP